MQGTSNAAVDKTAEKTGTEKVHEKLAERRRALGRGLESLLPGPRVVTAPTAPTLPQSARDGGWAGSPVPTLAVAPPDAVPGTLDELQAVALGRTADGETVFQLAIDRIDHNPYQTRREFDQQLLAELADSVRVQGVLQPIVVRAGTEGRFILILGERRLRASRMVGKASIPVIVRRVSEQQAAEMTLVENLQRQDLECLDQALAFSKLSTEFNLTQEEIGRRVGVSREQVSNYLRLLKLPPEVQVALRNKDLTYSHARLLLALDDESQITKVARVAIAKKMSVALLQELVLDSHMPKPEPAERQGGGARWVDPNVRAAQRSLEAVLGMRVRIRDRKGKGRITIEYGTLEDFDRVVRMLKGK